MESGRRCIAVLTSEVCENYQTMFIKGVKKRAEAAGYNVAVFASFFSKRMDSPLNETGENNIYKLINYDLFDGFIIIPNSISSSEALSEILDKIRATQKPIVYIDMESDEFYSVCSNDYSSIKFITNHLIKEHGFTRINCITGFKGMNLSENRLRGYIDALVENNIEVDERRYCYGDFWKIAPVKFVNDIIASDLELPQAIVCTNDTMAIATCEALKQHNIRVPEDIAVTGFDRLIDGRIFHPQISSLEPAMEEMGFESVNIILDLIAGNPRDKLTLIPGKFYPSESCGCFPDKTEKEAEDLHTLHHYLELSQYFVSSIYMSESLQESPDVDALFHNLEKYFYLLHDTDLLAIFLCDGWDALHEQETTNSPFIYSNMVNNVFIANTKGMKLRNPFSDNSEKISRFKSEYMFPPMFDDELPPKVYFFMPINFQDVTFGYSVCVLGESGITPDATFRNWTKYLSNALEHLRSKQHLQWALKRLERISEIDALTGVYNRFGYDNRINAMFEAAKNEGKDFLVIMGDLDCLKKINDNYGHAEGDNAIRIIAKAFQNSFTEDEACARIGGDEFIMFGSGFFTEEKLANYPIRINDYLDHYNSNSSKPYIIGISLGIVCQKAESGSVLKEWLDKADQNMYENKKGKIKIYLK